MTTDARGEAGATLDGTPALPDTYAPNGTKALERYHNVPMPGTNLVPTGWAENHVVPWLAEQVEERPLAEATFHYAALEAALRTIGRDTLEVTKARRYVEIRWGEVLGPGDAVKTGPGRNASHVSDVLGRMDRSRFRQLARLAPRIAHLIREAKDADEITRAALLKAGDDRKEKRKAEIEAQEEDLARSEPGLPKGRFHVIAMDPPWPYGNQSYDPNGRRVANPYPEAAR